MKNDTFQGIKISKMPPIPADENPFNHDFCNMGQTFGKNLTLMFGNHDTETCKYLILVFRNGKRVRLTFSEEDCQSSFPETCEICGGNLRRNGECQNRVLCDVTGEIVHQNIDEDLLDQEIKDMKNDFLG